jgi:hypothetical protein
MKNFLQGLIVSALATLAPIKAVLLTVGVLILSDFISGVLAANKRGEKISSAKMRNSITKCLVYQSAVITGFLVQTYLLQGFLPIVNIVASLIGLTELTSFYENLNVIKGGNIFKKIIELLGSANLAQADQQIIQDAAKEVKEEKADEQV